MTYAVNRTDGTVLTRINDGAINTTTTDLALFGKNFAGYGEFLNENFVKMLENFASTRQPAKPLSGQLWFDKGSNTLKVYSGTSFKPLTNITVSATQPSDLAQGDQWFDSANNQLYVYSGTTFRLIGPALSSGTALSGFQVVTIKDNVGFDRTIVKMNVDGALVAIISNTAFTPDLVIAGFPQIYKGYTLNSLLADVQFRGQASSAAALYDVDAGVNIDSTDLMRTDKDTSTSGNIAVNGNVTIGAAKLRLVVDSNDAIISNTETNKDILMRINYGGVSTNAVTIKGASKYVGIWNSSPAYALDVTGDSQVDGSLTVTGNVSVSTSPLYTDNSTKVATTAFVKNVLANSPALAGSPTATTASVGDSSTRIATTAFVTTAVNNVIDGAPGLLNTLNELAAAIDDDPAYFTTIDTRLTTVETDKADLLSPAFTGSPTTPTPPTATDNTTVANTEWVYNVLDLYVPRAGGTAVTMTGQFSASNGTVSLPGIIFGSNTATGLYAPSTNQLAFSTNAVEAGRFDTSQYLLLGYTTSQGSYKLQVNGQIYATNGTIATSDQRLKDRIGSLDGALDLVDNLTARTFNFKQGTGLELPENRQIGFIAQEVEQALQGNDWADCVVHRNIDADQTMAISEVKLVPLLVKAVQELRQEVKTLRKEISSLKGN